MGCFSCREKCSRMRTKRRAPSNGCILGSDTLELKCLQVLHLAKEDKKYADSVGENGLFSVLVKMLQDDTKDKDSKAIAAHLIWMSTERVAENRLALNAEGGVKELCNLVLSGSQFAR